MKPLIFWGIIGVAIMLLGCQPTNQQTGRPLSTAEKGNVSLGVRSAGQAFEYGFSLRNSGQIPLTVRQVESSCSCTVVEAQGRVIGAGKIERFTGRIEVSQGSGGVFTRRLKLHYAEVPTPTEVQLHYWVPPKRRVIAKPGILELGTVKAGQGQMEKTLTISGESRWLEGMKVEEVRVSAGVRLIELGDCKPVPHLDGVSNRTARLGFDFTQLAGIGSQMATLVLFPEAEDGVAVRVYWEARE